MNKRKSVSKMMVSAVIALSSLMVGACSNDFGPWPMPSGYVHHDSIYKAPPGPQPVFREMEERRKARENAGKEDCPVVASAQTQPAAPAESMGAAPMHDSAMAGHDWSGVANDLMGKIVQHFGKPSEPVWLETAEPHELGAALRESMAGQGLTIATMPGESPFSITYSVGGADGALVTVRMKSGSVVVAEESGLAAKNGGTGAPMPLGVMPEGNVY